MRLLAKNWEIFTNSTPIDSADSALVHATICAAQKKTPVYSNKITIDRNCPCPDGKHSV